MATRSDQKLTRQIVGIDCVRFLAASMVLLFHLGVYEWVSINYPHPFPQTFRIFVPVGIYGWLGVEIFFVISGFVIAYSAEDTTALRFVRSRFLRLFPTALVCATTTGIATLLLEGFNAHFGLLRVWLHSITFWPWGSYIDGSYWTLSIEVAFYTLIAILLLVRKIDAMPVVVGILGCCSSLFWILFFLPASWSVHLPLHSVVATLYANQGWNVLLMRHGCFFAVGAYLWLILLKAPSWRRFCILTFCIVGGLLQIIDSVHYWQMTCGFPMSSVTANLIWLVFLGVLVLSVRYNHAIQMRIGTHGVRVLREIGLLTYPLYLLHQRIGLDLIRHLRTVFPDRIAWGIAVALILVLTWILSTAINRFIPKKKRIRAEFSSAQQVATVGSLSEP